MITLSPLQESDREQFIKDNQEAFNYGALEEFGMRDNHFEEDEQIISRETIEKSIDGGEAYHIVEFFNSHHPDPNDPEMSEQMEDQFPDGMFHFEKRMY